MLTYRFLVDDWQVYGNRTTEPKVVANVIVEHRQKNLPLIVWGNGRVVKIPANKL